jgi:hypothetical protein
MKRILCGAVVVGATLLSGASVCRADDEKPAAPTGQPAEPTVQPGTPTPTVQGQPASVQPTNQVRTRGLRGRRDNGTYTRERGGRFAAFVQNIRNRRGR